MNIDFDFACRDDCLDQMVPSDLRVLVSERDAAVAEVERLREQIEYAFREGWNACEGDGKRQSTVNGAWYAYRRTLPDALREVKA